MRRIMRPLGLALALAGIVGGLIFGSGPVVQASGPEPTPTPASTNGAGGGGHPGG